MGFQELLWRQQPGVSEGLHSISHPCCFAMRALPQGVLWYFLEDTKSSPWCWNIPRLPLQAALVTINPCLVSCHPKGEHPKAFLLLSLWRWKYALVISKSFVEHKVKNPNLSHHEGSMRQLLESHSISPLTLVEIPSSDPESLVERSTVSQNTSTYPGQPGEEPGQGREEEP